MGLNRLDSLRTDQD